ncbi:MAG: hypothetical protein ACYC5F_10660 [Thermoleophilia bacterium]
MKTAAVSSAINNSTANGATLWLTIDLWYPLAAMRRDKKNSEFKAFIYSWRTSVAGPSNYIQSRIIPMTFLGGK